MPAHLDASRRICPHYQLCALWLIVYVYNVPLVARFGYEDLLLQLIVLFVGLVYFILPIYDGSQVVRTRLVKLKFRLFQIQI